jgi:hypothetical protein
MAFDAPNAQTACLCTTVRNVDSKEHFFGFLPPHGRRLAAGEELSFPGDIFQHIFRYTPNQRARRSLEAALRDGVMVIVNTPAVHVYDETLDNTKVLVLNAGSLAVADPCWGSYSSQSINPN